jgi:hypothetical protein
MCRRRSRKKAAAYLRHSRLLTNDLSCFDELGMNGNFSAASTLPPLALSKGEFFGNPPAMTHLAVLQRTPEFVPILDVIESPEVFGILFAGFHFEIDKDGAIFFKNFI